MVQKTRLEEALEENGEYRHVLAIQGRPEEIQSVLDNIASSVCAELSSRDIVEHMRAVYDETAEIYAGLPEHQYVTDVLIDFMELPHWHDGDHVLDLGCGPTARDAIFMSYVDKEARSSLMGRRQEGIATRERRRVPSIGFDVLAIDGSSKVVSLAARRLAIKKDEWRDSDSHFFRSRVKNADIHDVALSIDEKFRGVWSCAALFTHTPRDLVLLALSSIASVLEPKGVFGVTYSGANVGAYDNLRYSRTGRVKYFSRPRASVIASAAESAGFYLLRESYEDLDMGGEIQKNFFTTQFFQKK